MKSVHKVSLFAAAAISVSLVSSANASFNYDLRYPAGGFDPHYEWPAAPGNYTLQLWGQITGDTSLTNDGFIQGFVGITSTNFFGGAITSGGITSAVLGSNVQYAPGGPTAGSSNSITNGIADWGGSSTASTTGWLRWVAGGGGSPLADGTPGPESEKVNANTWEILIATFNLTINTMQPAYSNWTTTFNVVTPTGIKAGPFTTLSGVVYNQDGTSAQSLFGNVATSTSVTFHLLLPEPSSLCLLALGGLTLINRRRQPS